MALSFPRVVRSLAFGLILTAAFPVSAASFTLTKASWTATTKILAVQGTGTPRTAVVVTNASSNALVGNVIVGTTGNWQVVKINPLQVPCRVRAASGGSALEMDVAGAPSTCSGKMLVSVTVAGPAQVPEGTSASYTATANYTDGSTEDVTASAAWSDNSPFATISAGALTAGSVSSNQAVTVTASYTYQSTKQSGTKAVTIVNGTNTLTSVTVSGASIVPENTSANYTATAGFSDGSTQDVTASAVWSENSSYATISAGVLSAGSVSSNQTVTVTAAYTYGGTQLSGNLTITITNGAPPPTGTAKVIGWNDLGMHCMDSDYSVFSILPPYNNPHAQVLDANGNLVTDTSAISVTYEGVADPTGSINTTSLGKTNFWTYVNPLLGASVPVDMGISGSAMPGSANTPQGMGFETPFNWYVAKGVPITPFDDAKKKNYYPLVKLSARNASNTVLGSTSIVLPVSDEVTCVACHASGSDAAAMPSSGWVYDADPEHDYRLNILKLHDQYQLGTSDYTKALSQAGYSTAGLYDNVTVHNAPILCDKCHPSNALPVSVTAGLEQLTTAVHRRHAGVTDPATGKTLEANTDRSACYRCHPGSTTRCLRGAMGNATAADASFLIQCQDCHGSMNTVGATTRQGWFEEPNCQNCHTGTAANNNGQIRYSNAFDSPGHLRTAVNATFATNPDTPAAGISLYRFSSGHGGLQCEACHGPTHAEYPSADANGNIQSIAFQGHKGMLSECGSCHPTVPSTTTGGPHGLHPLGQSWVEGHHEGLEGNTGACKACHGNDFRGTVLSRTQADRTLTSGYGTINAWRGFQISCYACHNGPGGEGSTSNHPAAAASRTASAATGAKVTIPLTATDADGNTLTLRIVSQPSHGHAGLSGTTAAYISDPGYTGTDSFTFAAWDGSIDSNLATVTITVHS
jgi:hypothetical protein